MICHIQPNQVQSFAYPGEAWRWALQLIDRFGERVTTEDGQQTKEIRNLMVQVENPLEGFPIEGSGWDLPAMDCYTYSEILNETPPEGFKYSYGQRLLDYHIPDHVGAMHYYDQINMIITKLLDAPATRRAIAITWQPQVDPFEKSAPCLQMVDYLIRGDELHCAATFRSQSIDLAWVPNAYGLAQLQKHIAEEVGVEMGTLTTFSVSAHIYVEGQ